MATSQPDRPAAKNPKSLSGLLPFIKPYRWQIGLALVLLVMAAATTLLFPWAIRHLIDSGFAPADRNEQVMAMRGNFLLLFGVAVALGVFSAGRFFTVSWLGERVTADLRNAVYRHVLQQSPEFFETTSTGEVTSRLIADTTLVQTVVGSSLSMGLRNAVMGLGALIVLVWSHPTVMLQVILTVVLVVLPATWYGRRVRRLSRASQDRVADSSTIASEVLNAIPIVQSYNAQTREADRFADSTEQGFQTAVRRTRARSILVAFIIIDAYRKGKAARLNFGIAMVSYGLLGMLSIALFRPALGNWHLACAVPFAVGTLWLIGNGLPQPSALRKVALAVIPLTALIGYVNAFMVYGPEYRVYTESVRNYMIGSLADPQLAKPYPVPFWWDTSADLTRFLHDAGNPDFADLKTRD